MKKITLLIVLFNTICFSQNNVDKTNVKKDMSKGKLEKYKQIDKGGFKLFIISDVKATTSQNNNEVPNTGTGKLGLKFKKNYFYGDILFNVLGTNQDLTQTDSSKTKLFANNLLIPDNSGQGISNFRVSMGLKSLAKFENKWDTIPLLSPKRIGLYGFWQANNTIWTKEESSLPVYISSLGLYVTYHIISLQQKILGQDEPDEPNINLYWFGGYENRILGGDYRLDKNKDQREIFLGTDKVKFKGFPSVGFKLELGNFYGKITETKFDDEDISGFSGWQATIEVGFNLEIKLTKNEDVKENEKS